MAIVMEKRWIRKPAPDPEKVRLLADALRVKETIVALLCQRDVCTFDEARAYFRPSLRELPNPLLAQSDEAGLRCVAADGTTLAVRR